MSAPRVDLEVRFLVKTRRGDAPGCIDWTGARDQHGYGRIAVSGRPIQAHRIAWTLAHGPIPAGAWVLHRCDRPACVAVAHLFLGGPGDNSRDMAAKGRHHNSRKTRCKNGHALVGVNVRVDRHGSGKKRVCRRCEYLNKKRSRKDAAP